MVVRSYCLPAERVVDAEQAKILEKIKSKKSLIMKPSWKYRCYGGRDDANELYLGANTKVKWGKQSFKKTIL